jgi:hypothetical protein
MINRIAILVRGLFRKGIPAHLVEALSDLCVKIKPSIALRYRPPTSTHGAVMPLVVADKQRTNLLHEIPSQTTRAERHFLYHFFRYFWGAKMYWRLVFF